MSLRDWLGRWVADDPNPEPSRLDRLDGLAMRGEIPDMTDEQAARLMRDIAAAPAGPLSDCDEHVDQTLAVVADDAAPLPKRPVPVAPRFDPEDIATAARWGLNLLGTAKEVTY